MCGSIPMKMPFNTEPNFHIRIWKLPLDDGVLTPSNMNGENAERIKNWGYIFRKFLPPRRVQMSLNALAVTDKTGGNRKITSLYSGDKRGSIVVVYFPSKYSKPFSDHEKLAGA